MENLPESPFSKSTSSLLSCIIYSSPCSPVFTQQYSLDLGVLPPNLLVLLLHDANLREE
ncbi:hypothetical protein HAX54_012969, partial [Datura stramonium]|nr:hypothetical protein [Datura stramonium]